MVDNLNIFNITIIINIYEYKKIIFNLEKLYYTHIIIIIIHNLFLMHHYHSSCQRRAYTGKSRNSTGFSRVAGLEFSRPRRTRCLQSRGTAAHSIGSYIRALKGRTNRNYRSEVCLFQFLLSENFN